MLLLRWYRWLRGRCPECGGDIEVTPTESGTGADVYVCRECGAQYG